MRVPERDEEVFDLMGDPERDDQATDLMGGSHQLSRARGCVTARRCMTPGWLVVVGGPLPAVEAASFGNTAGLASLECAECDSITLCGKTFELLWGSRHAWLPE